MFKPESAERSKDLLEFLLVELLRVGRGSSQPGATRHARLGRSLILPGSSLCLHHESHGSEATPNGMGCPRLIRDTDPIVFIGRGHKIDERGIEIDVMRHQDAIGFQSFPEIPKLQILVLVSVGAIVQEKIDLIRKRLLIHELFHVSNEGFEAAL